MKPWRPYAWKRYTRAVRKEWTRELQQSRRDHKRLLGSHKRFAMIAYGRECQEIIDATPEGETAHLRGGTALVLKPIVARGAVDGHGILIIALPGFRGGCIVRGPGPQENANQIDFDCDGAA